MFMELATITPIQAWQATTLPRVTATDWDPTTAHSALKELKRLRGELDAATAVLVSVVAESSGRDSKATVVRELGVSQIEAGRITRTAKVVAALDGVAEAIAAGEYTADHVQRVAKLKNPDDAVQLLALAATESPDDFEKRINKFLVNTAGPERRARQRAERSVKFFTTKEGSRGMRAILPDTEGKILEANLQLIVDEQYLRDHPERASVAGEHEIDRLEQRLADALIEAVNGDRETPSTKPGDETETEPTDDATKSRKRTNKPLAKGRTAVIVTISLEELEAQILGHGTIDTTDALSLFGRLRTDIYFCVRNATGAIMKFGRDRRFATQMQKFAMAVLQNGICHVPGCENTWNRSDAHHEPPYKPVHPGDPPGLTNIDTMKLPCRLHHQHEHDTGKAA
jgi:hypothetical protein